MSIYCKDCRELGERIGVKTAYCLKYAEALREVPMDEAAVKYPVKCLKCIEGERCLKDL